jgi:hypothetical protein
MAEHMIIDACATETIGSIDPVRAPLSQPIASNRACSSWRLALLS